MLCIAVTAEIEERKKKLAAERADNDGALLELDNVKNAKLKDEQKIEQLTKGWRMEREQVTILLGVYMVLGYSCGEVF